MKFTNPQGQTLDVNSSDGSIPSERELDQMFSIKYGQSQKPSAYSEYGAPFAHALSLIAGDIPKAIGSRDISPAGQEAYRTLYPEQQTGLGKALRFATSAPAFAVGLPGKAALGAGRLLTAGAAKGTKLLPNFLGKSFAGKTALRTGEFGASQAAIAPKEGEDYGKQVGIAAGMGAVVPGAGLLAKSVGKGAVGTGTFIAKTFGGITDFSRETIKRLGSARVFDPLKQSAGYLGEVVVPKAKKFISDKVVDAKDRMTLKALGLNNEEINNLVRLSPIYKQRLSEVLQGENVNIKRSIEVIKEDANKRFFSLMKRQNPNQAIDVKAFYNNLKSSLISQGWLTRSGEIAQKYGRNPVRDQLLDIYGKLTTDVKTATGGYAKYVLNIPEYENIRNALSTAISGNPANDRILFMLGTKIRESAAKTIKGLEGVNKLYSDAEKLIEIENRGVFSKMLNPERLERELWNLKNIDRPNQVARIKSIIGKELTDDVEAHLVNVDLGLTSARPGAAGGIFPGPSGIKKALLSGVAKKYYRDVYPQTQKVKGLYEALRGGTQNIYQRPLFSPAPPYQNPINKLSGNRGGIEIGKPSGSTVEKPSRPFSQGLGQALKKQQGKQGIVGGEGNSALLAEARKYKTAEEFVENPYGKHTFDSLKKQSGFRRTDSELEIKEGLPALNLETGKEIKLTKKHAELLNFKGDLYSLKDEDLNMLVALQKNYALSPGKERLFYRTGKPPESGQSYNTREQKSEKGISTYFFPEVRSFAGTANKDWYVARGRQISWGGDDEPVIFATSEWKKFQHPAKSQLTALWHEAQEQSKKLGEALKKQQGKQGIVEPSPAASLKEEAKKYKTAEEFVEAQFSKRPDYGMSHRPTYEGMPPAYNLLEGDAIPRDVYTNPDFSISSGRVRSGDKAANESWNVLQKIRNNPEAEVTVHRAGATNKLNTGDWITFSKDYAKQSVEGTEKVTAFKIKAKDAIFAGDDINEFGYYPKSQLTALWHEAQEQSKKLGQALKRSQRRK